ncbi:kit ligand a [Nematolebias whitei]|uniref:kit ligand a n=1 Tax=Nematolebias whitei TaxID=451745 RepID=UPI001898E6F6|nr:kit ligand a [Nematolebias whitei]
MKKSKSWIHVCVRFLLFITLGVHSATLEVTAVTDDTHVLLPTLKQNIPKDYKIPVLYIPKEVAGMCWVKLNIFNLEQSLQNLANKFGNISANKDHINLVIQYLHDVRIKISNDLDEEMIDFECHYSKESWATAQYFEFVKELYRAAHYEDFSYECDPPPCPSTPPTDLDNLPSESTTPLEPPANKSKSSLQTTKCFPIDCPSSQGTQGGDVFDLVKLILPSLMFVPLLALVLLLVWKVKSRRNRQDRSQNPGEELFTSTEGMTSPLNAETPEKIILNVIETV